MFGSAGILNPFKIEPEVYKEIYDKEIYDKELLMIKSSPKADENSFCLNFAPFTCTI